MTIDQGREATKLKDELRQHRALLSALVAKVGITQTDLMPYINAKAPSPIGDSGDEMRLEEADRALALVSPRPDYIA